MKRALQRDSAECWHFVDGKKIPGPPKEVSVYMFVLRGDLTGVRGNLSAVYGDLSGVRGDLSGVRGDLTDVRGDLSGVRGDLSGVRGDLDDCELSQEDRDRGVSPEELIAEGDDE